MISKTYPSKTYKKNLLKRLNNLSSEHCFISLFISSRTTYVPKILNRRLYCIEITNLDIQIVRTNSGINTISKMNS